MTRKALFLLAAASLAVATPSFSQAAPGPGPGGWLSIQQREANLNARIDAGIRNRTLTMAEAASLRAELRVLEGLEASYRATGGGLDMREREELDRRFDALSMRIRDQVTDVDVGASPFAGRFADLANRIDAGSRRGVLSPAETADLRYKLEDIRRVERDNRLRGGLSQTERNDINRRLDILSVEIDRQSADGERGGPWNQPGWNGGPWTPGGRWQTIQERRDDFNRIIEPGIRSGRISRNEANYLQNEFNRLVTLERRYRAGGLSANERAELDRQFNVLVQRIRAEAYDNNNGRGGGRGPGRGPGGGF